jgi:protein O-GlcNAc transferase
MSDPRIPRAVALLQAGNLPAAESLCLAIIAATGQSDPAPHALLGRVQASAGRLQDARRAVDDALRIDPDHRLSLLEDAELARRERAPLRAEQSLRRLLQLEPGNPRFHANLAAHLLATGQPAEARAAAAAALGLDPQRVELQILVADTEHAAGEHAAAMVRWRALSITHPQLARVWVGLGRAAERLGDERLAADAFALALQRDQRNPEALRGTARACLVAQDQAGALRANQRLLELQPDAVDAWYGIALAHWQAQELEQAGTALDAVLSRAPDHLPARWARGNLPPGKVHDDDASAQAFVARYLRTLDEFEALGDAPGVDPAAIKAALSLASNFYIHYLREHSSDEQRRAGALLRRHARRIEGDPELPPRPPRARPLVLFVSSFLHEHSVAKLFERVLAGLAREQLEILVLSATPTPDEITTRFAAAADGFLGTRREPDRWRAWVLDTAPDIIVFLDLGMDPMLQWLAAQRLAPVQCVLWGHPVTSGMDSIDWFLTADAMEREGGEADYSERVFRLPGLGCRFAAPTDGRPDAAFALAAVAPGGTRFGLPQTFVKLTPIHDTVLARIAVAVPTARFELAPGPGDSPRRRLLARLQRNFAAVGLRSDGYISVHPQLQTPQWLALIRSLDVNLDSIGWSGGVSSLEILWFDVPTLTLPGHAMRSRHTLAMLRLMEIDWLVASDLDDYVRRAVELARSPGLRAQLRGLIAERKHRLYDDPAVSASLQAFLLALAAGRAPPVAGLGVGPAGE